MDSKKCSSCRQIKTLDLFGVKNNKPRSDCKECVNKKSREYYKKNIEKVKKIKKKWKQNNPEKVREEERRWYKNNIDAITEYKRNFYTKNKEKLNEESRKYHFENKEKDNERSRKWHKENPEKSRVLNIKRREREQKFGYDYGEKQYAITMEIFDYKCVKCKTKDNLCIDHHYCLIKGNGLNNKNAVVLCRTCNSSKGTKDPGDFYSEEEIKIINKLLKQTEENWFTYKKEKNGHC